MKKQQTSRRLRPFLLWLAVFYTAWALVVVLGAHAETLLRHWGIAAAMAAGSYVAGSTPMGGGTVGFPILVLLFDQPATLGRDFSFAIQAIGMTSASIFILCTRQPLEWPMLRAAMIGSAVGTPLGIFLVAPLVPELTVKVVFAVLWASFGLLHLHRFREITSNEGITPTQPRFDAITGLLIGFLGGLTVASITGAGVDMMLYVALVLLCHADLKIAIPTSVIIMAFTSVLGILVKLAFGDVAPGVFEHWLAAAPVVALGAPLGALIVSRMGRKPTLFVVSLLCLFQFAWTMSDEWHRLGLTGLLLAGLGLLLFGMTFQWMHRLGMRLARRSRRTENPPVVASGRHL
ncbi:MAG: sulfite exporter TauE/SafE family protein [Xanthomonadales bacterium]|nr:sulfite exporter TauE/SafE family protein [Xanthomonadales bacterium]